MDIFTPWRKHIKFLFPGEVFLLIINRVHITLFTGFISGFNLVSFTPLVLIRRIKITNKIFDNT